MRSRLVLAAVLSCAVALVGCSDSTGDGETTSTSGGTTSSGEGGASSSTGTTGDGGGATTGVGGAGGGTGGGEPSCTSALKQAIGPVDIVSTGEVKVLSTDGAAKTLYIDASAGGIMNQQSNPWVYLRLGTAAKADVTDETAFDSSGWDIAFKRPIIRSNSGDSGPGKGGVAFLDGKAFDAVTAADAASAKLVAEDWFEDDCTMHMDQTGALATSFTGWYDYEAMKLAPHPGVFIVRGGDGAALYKIAILDYYATSDGGQGMSGGHYKIVVAPLQ